MKSSFFLGIILTASTLLNVHLMQAYSFKPKNEKVKLNIKYIEQENVHADFSDSCCDATKHKKDCTTQKICSIISKLNIVKSQIATIDSNIDNGFATVQADLDEIAEIQVEQLSQLDGIASVQAEQTTLLEDILALQQSSAIDQCCATVISSIDSLAELVADGFAGLAAQNAALANDLTECCSTLNSKIDSIPSGSCDLSTISSQIDSLDTEIAECCFTTHSQLDALVIASCDLSTVISSVDRLSENLSACCNSLVDGINNLENAVSTVSSKADKIDNDINICCFTLNSKIDLLVTHTGLESCDLAPIQSKLDSLFVEVESCCVTLNSKLDELASAFTINPTCDVATLSSKIDLCCETLNSKIDNVNFGVSSRIELCCTVLSSEIATAANCCFTVDSKLDFILSRTGGSGSSCICTFTCNCSGGSNLCTPTPITAPTTINSSGSYCLAQDLFSADTQTILINASNVVLDLNGHNIDNISSSTEQAALRINGQTNVVIKNGSIKHNGGTNGTGVGIDCLSSRIATIEQLTVGGTPGGNMGWATGVQSTTGNLTITDSAFVLNHIGLVSNSAELRLERCNFDQSTSDGAQISQSFGFIKDCTFTGASFESSSANGLTINGGFDMAIYDSNFSGNSASGSNGVFIENSSGIAFYNCVAQDNGGNGFSIGGLDDNRAISFNNCFASSNSFSGNGFNIVNTQGLSMLNCVAENNTNGVTVDDVSTGIIRGCTCASNTTFGFNNASTTMSYFSNVACNNGTNFNGVTNAPVTSAVNAQAFENVDCTNTTPNQVESKLDILLFR